MEQILLSFGPIGFGTVVLIVLWKMIVMPELASRRVEQKAMEAQIQSLNDLTTHTRDTAVIQQTTTQAMSAMIDSQRVLVRELKDLADHSKRA
jgi:hypothetical protein